MVFFSLFDIKNKPFRELSKRPELIAEFYHNDYNKNFHENSQHAKRYNDDHCHKQTAEVYDPEPVKWLQIAAFFVEPSILYVLYRAVLLMLQHRLIDVF